MGGPNDERKSGMGNEPEMSAIGLPHLRSWTILRALHFCDLPPMKRFVTTLCLVHCYLSFSCFFDLSSSWMVSIGWLIALLGLLAWGMVQEWITLLDGAHGFAVAWIASFIVSFALALILMRLSEGAGAIVEELARRWACFHVCRPMATIWSEHDEALNGLRAATRLEGTLLPRLDADPTPTVTHYADAFRSGRPDRSRHRDRVQLVCCACHRQDGVGGITSSSSGQ